MDEKVETAITESPLFKHLKPEVVEDIVAASEIVERSKGDTVIEEGSRVDSLYIVRRGSCEAYGHAYRRP